MNVIAYRRAKPSDMPLIYDSWIDSFRSSYSAGPIPMPLYKGIMRTCIEWIMGRPDVELWVAYRPDEEAGFDLYGWACVEWKPVVPERRWDPKTRKRVTVMEVSERPLIHYIFVKQPYRKMGVAKGILEACGVHLNRAMFYSFSTPIIKRLAPYKAPMARWAPLLARFPKNEPMGRNNDEDHGEDDDACRTDRVRPALYDPSQQRGGLPPGR